MGAIGVELAGTGTTSRGAGLYDDITTITERAVENVDLNSQLQWQEGYCRGYFHLDVTQKAMTALFYGA
jgi:alkaline phosphatase D